VATVTRKVSVLLRTPTLAVGEFRCPTDDESWRQTNLIGDRAHVVFPRVPVLIRQAGHEPVLATANHTMLYDANRRYDREARSRRGDDCVFVELAGGALASLAREGARLLSDDCSMAATHAPTEPRTYLAQHLLVRYLRDRPADLLPAEDLAVRLVLAALGRPPLRGRPCRPRTSSAHRELAEAAKAELAADPAAATTLDDLAHRLHTSAFHLARVFRAETGFSLARYRRALRLRTALERLPDSRGRLSALGLELGFSSHSHFAMTFRREFGVPPTAVENMRQVRALLAPV